MDEVTYIPDDDSPALEQKHFLTNFVKFFQYLFFMI